MYFAQNFLDTINYMIWYFLQTNRGPLIFFLFHENLTHKLQYKTTIIFILFDKTLSLVFTMQKSRLSNFVLLFVLKVNFLVHNIFCTELNYHKYRQNCSLLNQVRYDYFCYILYNKYGKIDPVNGEKCVIFFSCQRKFLWNHMMDLAEISSNDLCALNQRFFFKSSSVINTKFH